MYIFGNFSLLHRDQIVPTVDDLSKSDDRSPRPVIGWWSADPRQLTGQGIVTARVVAMLERVDAPAFSYRGSGMQSISTWLLSGLRLAGYLLRRRLGTLYLVCSRSNAGFIRDLPAYFSLFAGVRVIVHVHGSDIVDLCQRPCLGVIARTLLARCELVVPSAHLIAPLQALGVRKIHLCENFVEHANPLLQSIEVHQLTAAGREWRVLWNSNVMASKGFFQVAEAVGILSDEGVRVRLIALGKPIGDEAMSVQSCSEALQRLEGKHWIERPGQVDRPTAMRLLYASDIVCLPSYYASECQPLTLIEAMCAARPLVIADTPALRATVGDYSCEIVTEQSTAAVKAALQRLFLMPPADEVLHAAAEQARKRFSAQRFDYTMHRLFGLNASAADVGAVDRVHDLDEHTKL